MNVSTHGKILAFTGTHGTGKTTAVYDLAAKLKKQQTGDVRVILETARNCPLDVLSSSAVPIERAQMWIFAEQMRLEIEALLFDGITISDRTVVDSIAYSRFCGFDELANAQMEMARRHVGIYTGVYLCVANGCEVTNDGFRNTCSFSQMEVQRHIIDIYNELGVILMPRSAAFIYGE